jgi:16S rRNA (guanine(527)-N(7))-methyltransferase RsmG
MSEELLKEKADALRQLIRAGWGDLSEEGLDRCVEFYRKVLKGNEAQNLTRLTEPMQFWKGFVLDVKELLKSGLVEFPAMDLGSGAGVPGLLAAAVRPDPWILVDSEGNKARFLKETTEALGLATPVYGERGEAVLQKTRVGSVVCKAVGPVGRIYGWLKPCSTWNSLVLLKGRAWPEEWSEFSAANKDLRVSGQHTYAVEGEAERHIVQLTRVPRGTSA